MDRKAILSIALIFSAILIFSCSGGKMDEKHLDFDSIKDVPDAVWQKLNNKKIYFGHRSVGNNILDGIKDVMKENPKIRLNIAETTDQADFNVGLLGHSHIGDNGDPISKINAFSDVIENGLGKKVDIASLKFCFADFTTKTKDITKIFNDYKNTMSQLKKKYPRSFFVHFTVPLVINKTTWKTWIKIFLRKAEIWEYDQNIIKNKFNDLIRKEYDGKEPIFDIAKIESTNPDGSRSTFTRNGKIYHSLVPKYSSDGGHLNESGRKIVAEQFLIFLARVS
jgi:hypothetical protein